MILWSIQWIIISTFLIGLIHYLYSFFENMLTVPKSKDLVYKLRYTNGDIDDMINTSSVKNDIYSNDNSSIINTISNTISNTITDTISDTISNNTITNTISNNMELELEQFLQSVKSNNSTQSQLQLPVH
jgi:hypothetical protein